MALTGNVDTDILILNQLNDQELFQICVVNRRVRNTCEILFQRRILQRTNLALTVLTNLKNAAGQNTWREFYLYLYYQHQ